MTLRKRLALTLGLCLTLSAILPLTAQAAYAQSTNVCSGWKTNNFVCLYENGGQSGDRLLTNQSISNLHNISHSLPGDCNAVIGSSTWGDCISSFRVFLSSGYVMCIYENTGYGGKLIHREVGPDFPKSVTLSAEDNDKVSSVYIGPDGVTGC